MPSHCFVRWQSTESPDSSVTYVQKSDNPPNVPESRCIEDFWAYLKGLVYKNNWQAKDISSLKKRIHYCIKTKIDLDFIQKLVKSTSKRLNKIRRYGVIEAQQNK